MARKVGLVEIMAAAQVGCDSSGKAHRPFRHNPADSCLKVDPGEVGDEFLEAVIDEPQSPRRAHGWAEKKDESLSRSGGLGENGTTAPREPGPPQARWARGRGRQARMAADTTFGIGRMLVAAGSPHYLRVERMCSILILALHVNLLWLL